MRTVLRSLLSVAFCTVMVCNAAPLPDGRIKVTSQGVTDVAAVFGKTHVSVKITTHELDIGKLSDEWPEKRLSSCTYSRVPCSLVDYVEISVDGSALLVARSVYADLADVGVASLSQKKKGQFVLTLGGGDASESYTVEVEFNNNLIRQRIFVSNEARQVMEKTTYFSPQSLNN